MNITKCYGELNQLEERCNSINQIPLILKFGDVGDNIGECTNCIAVDECLKDIHGRIIFLLGGYEKRS